MRVFIGCYAPLCKKLMPSIVHNRRRQRNSNWSDLGSLGRPNCPVSALTTILAVIQDVQRRSSAVWSVRLFPLTSFWGVY